MQLAKCLQPLWPSVTPGAALGWKETAGTASGWAAKHLRRGKGLVGLYSAIMHTYSFMELKTNPSVIDLVFGA
jgi:hypothetical protein